MDGQTLGIVLAVYAVIVWVLVFLVWRRAYGEWKSGRIRKLRARVVDKRETIHQEPADQGGQAANHVVVFEFDGRQKEFTVGPAAYPSWQIGEEGFLYLRGNEFASFEPESTDDADEVYRRMVRD